MSTTEIQLSIYGHDTIRSVLAEVDVLELVSAPIGSVLTLKITGRTTETTVR